MEGVEKLTDILGGIELTSIENIPSKTLTVSKGEKITLSGRQARTYIAYRDDDVEANARRMERQKQFMTALMNKLASEISGDFSKLTTIYTTLSPYFNTNVSFAQTAYLAQSCLSLNFGDSIDYKSIDGALIEGEEWIEFEADEESLLKTVIDVFYSPK